MNEQEFNAKQRDLLPDLDGNKEPTATEIANKTDQKIQAEITDEQIIQAFLLTFKEISKSRKTCKSYPECKHGSCKASSKAYFFAENAINAYEQLQDS